VDDYTTVIQPCAESSEGADMLKYDADRCNELNTHTSATIRIAGKNVCVRDGGEWKDCKSVMSLGGGDVALGLQKTIEKEWKKVNSKGVLKLLRNGKLMNSCIGKLIKGDDCGFRISAISSDVRGDFRSPICMASSFVLHSQHT